MKLALFFTRGMSLKLWDTLGLLDREKLIYERMLEQGHMQKIFWLTYGASDVAHAEKLRAEGRLHSQIHILPMPKVFDSKIGQALYSLYMPWHWRAFLQQVDCLKTNQIDGAWAAVLAKKICTKPLFVRTGYTLSQFLAKDARSLRAKMYRLIEKYVYGQSDAASVSSKHDRKYLEAFIKNIEFTQLPNYIDTQMFSAPLELAPSQRLCTVGRLSRQKNYANLIQAVANMGLSLDVYGDGELKEDLQNLAKSLHADVVFHGKVSNAQLPHILRSHRYFVLPSFYEGMPKSLLEAMACGCVCLGTDVAGIQEVIVNNENGILAEGTSVEALEKAIARMLESDGQLLSQGAVCSIEEKFSLQIIVSQELAILRVLCEG